MAAPALALPPPPPGFVVDGDLAEWTAPPTWVLGAEGALVGKGLEPPRGPEDVSAEVRLAFDPVRGLAVSVRVRDDAVTLPGPSATDERVVRSDHVELWVSFGEAPLPPIGWGIGGVGEITLGSEADCADHREGFDCPAWLREQQQLRRELTAGFRRQILLSERGLQVVVGPALDPPIGEAVVRPEPGGWIAEALVPPSALPPMVTEPTSAARVLVEIVDNDLGWDRQESFVSTAPRRSRSDPSTWPLVTLERPSSSKHPSASAAALVGHDGWWRDADPASTVLHRFANVTAGYQFTPGKTSPVTWTLPLADVPLGELGGVAVWASSCDDGGILVATRDGRSLGSATTAPRTKLVIARGSDRAILVSGRNTWAGEFGLRPGSANAAVAIGAYGVVDGRFVPVLSSVIEPDGEGRVLLELGLAADGRLVGLRVRGQEEDAPVLKSWAWKGEVLQEGEPAGASWTEVLRLTP
ncbi:MAG: hypothetical protein H6738_01210 [Alphaproteobacteria bacterium]|nr:hypothetical protein [Alphaproteobacteria bacterium]MCB9695386.1 hypothetical protein [Alphaproteobacteria bacterium]